MKSFPLTIGLPVHEDFHGLFFTINALRLYHSDAIEECELVVVDNSPDTPTGQETRKMVSACSRGFANVEYIPFREARGPAAAKNLIFEHAHGDAVLCLDAHVMLERTAIKQLMDHFYDNPETLDLYHGPLLQDDLISVQTHFSPRWRGNMEGTWSLAWRCTKCNQLIDVIDRTEQGQMAYRPLAGNGRYTSEYVCTCGHAAPICQFEGHEAELLAAGWEPYGMRRTDAPFEIPAQGMGLFACRRSAWLGFSPLFRGFGGEEVYIHRKYRQAGRKTWCLPFLRWHHRFGRPEGVKYNLNFYGSARNYVLGHLETDTDLTEARNHLVQPGKLTAEQWAHLVADPVAHETAPGCQTCAAGGQTRPISEAELPQADRERFAALAGQHDRVAVLGKRDWWQEVVGPVRGSERPRKLEFHPANGQIPEIEECDLLVIHSRHHAESLYAELVALAPRTTQRILLRSTGAFGEQAEGGGPGLLPAMRRFLRENPEWHIIEHSQANWGYTILSRAAEDRKKLPGIFTMAKNLAAAVAAHVANGMEQTSKQGLEARLNVCSLCPQRQEDRCTVCGCFVAAKASMKVSECPLGMWPGAEEGEKGRNGNAERDEDRGDLPDVRQAEIAGEPAGPVPGANLSA